MGFLFPGWWLYLDMYRLAISILLSGSIFGQVFDHQIGEKIILNKHNVSVGMFDDRTGLSLIGYTYNLKQTTMDEYFIGAGTMLLAFTGTMGWKHYYRKSKLSVSSVVCGQYIAHLGFTGFMSTMSTSLEYNLAKWAKVKLGGLGLIIFADGEVDIGAFPFAGLNFTF